MGFLTTIRYSVLSVLQVLLAALVADLFGCGALAQLGPQYELSSSTGLADLTCPILSQGNWLLIYACLLSPPLPLFFTSQ
jgi:hypothetical protein